MPAPGGIVMITSGFPRLSETFVLNELLALEGAGALAGIFATKPGDGTAAQPGSGTLLDRVEVLPDGPPAVQAAHVAQRIGRGGALGVHAYFAHAPSAVAEHAAGLLRIPYSFGVHARDLRKVAPAELARRARAAARVVACNRDVADELRPTGAAVDLVPHGVDLRRFRPAAPPASEPLRLLAVGRLVEKKGFEVLIEAVRGLTVPLRLRLVGDGPLRERLEGAVAAAGAGDRIELLGPRTHDELPDEYAGAHALVVPSVEDSTGDRDGLPNVVLEAMASGRAVVASAIAGIPSAVRDGETGLLVPPGDPLALRAALERLALDPSLRARAGAAARARVERDFELQSCAARLRRCLEGAYA